MSREREAVGIGLFRRGLARTLLLWFFMLSLVPLTAISLISYREISNRLTQDSFQEMAIQAAERGDRVRADFERLKTALRLESERRNNEQFMAALLKLKRDMGQPAEQLVTGFAWARLVDQWETDLRSVHYAFGYQDVLLVDAQGDVLYSVIRDDLLGSNLFHGMRSGSALAAAARNSLDSGRPSFSDLDFVNADRSELAGYLMAPLLDEQGEKTGLLVLRISDRYLRSLLGAVEQHFEGKLFLIGTDLRLRSVGSHADDLILRTRVETPLTRDWLERALSLAGDKAAEVMTLLYRDHRDHQVLGAIHSLPILDKQWAVVAEVGHQQAFARVTYMGRLILGMLLAMVLIFFLVSLPLIRRIVTPLLLLNRSARHIAEGDLDYDITIAADNEIGRLAKSFNSMLGSLRQARQQQDEHNWLRNGLAELNERTRGDQGTGQLCKNVISCLAAYLGASLGAVYLRQSDDSLQLFGSYAFPVRKGLHNRLAMGEGLVGQSALEGQKILLSEVPADYVQVSSALGQAAPAQILVVPFSLNGRVVGVLEFGSLGVFGQRDFDLLDEVTDSIAILVAAARNRDSTRELLERTRSQAEQLAAQEEELRENNQLLEQQTADLRRSKDALSKNQAELEEKNEAMAVQQEELRIANQELEEKAQDLSSSRDLVESKNQALQQAQQELEQRAQEVERASRYKSEFLANMSHELRTPLNSLLILAKMLADNKGGNLSDKQVEFSRTIYDSGSDLLNLINDILDLSKIEAGKMQLLPEDFEVEAFVEALRQRFEPLCAAKSVRLRIDLQEAPETWHTDHQKLDQVIKNLMSNAVKFTAQGEVSLEVALVTEAEESGLEVAEGRGLLRFRVADTGIGIPAGKQADIFEAFHQVDGTTSRKYGGTGLGLSITRQLVKLLGGVIKLESKEDEGSCFTLYLPHGGSRSRTQEGVPLALVRKPVAEPATRREAGSDKRPEMAAADGQVTVAAAGEIPDDRAQIEAGDRSVLIIEDDARFAMILADKAREHGFKALVAANGETGLHFADYYRPSGIILDVGLPGIDGWKVMDRLKNNLETRHIPVHFMSAADQPLDAMKRGAIGYLTKPVALEDVEGAFLRIEDVIDRPVKKLLLVEDNETQLNSMRELLASNDLEIGAARSGAEARALLQQGSYDCLVLDLGLPDEDGLQLLESIRKNPALVKLPVVVYSGKEFGPQERELLERYAQSIIIKNVRSPERLLDDTALFLHRVESRLPETRRDMIKMLHDHESLFKGRKALLVDDDMRNVFALSSVLQEKEMDVQVAKNGLEALQRLQEHEDTAIVLMDIMMPEMDGYEAIRRIRAQPRFTDLPIIALTAKAMRGDRTKCIESGANDYLAKPVDSEKLLSMMRVWLYR